MKTGLQMSMRPSLRYVIVVTLFLGSGRSLAGQAPALLAGGTVGNARMPDHSSAQGLTGVFALQVSWFTVSAAPTMVRVTDSLGGTPTSGFGDLPVSLAVEHDVSGAWSPDLGAALDLTLPTGSTQTGIGSGQTSSGVDVGVGVSPVDPLHLSVNASRDLSGGTTGLVTTGATWIGGDVAWSFADRWNASASVGGEVG